MKYGLGIKLFIAFFAGGIGVLYKYKLNPKLNQSEISSVMNIPRKFLFDTLMTPANVPAYFSWITRLHSEDRRNITIGKRYRGIVNMPFLGQHDIRYRVTELRKGHWVILSPDDQSYFNTEIILMLSSITDNETQFQLKIAYHRTSALFQLTLGPFLKWLTDQQLRRTVLSVRTLVTAKWNKHRYPHEKKNTTAKTKPNINQTPKYSANKIGGKTPKLEL